MKFSYQRLAPGDFNLAFCIPLPLNQRARPYQLIVADIINHLPPDLARRDDLEV
jgi:hypothetical protein